MSTYKTSSEKGKSKARMLTRARILLLSTEGKTDEFIVYALKVAPRLCEPSESGSPKKGYWRRSPSGLVPGLGGNWTGSRKPFW